MTGPINVFEWCWEHSRTTGIDRSVLLYQAFHCDEPTHIVAKNCSQFLGLDPVDVTDALNRLIDLQEISVDWNRGIYRFPTYEMWRRPHTITLNTWNGKPYEGEDAHRWDFIEIECPHRPATETMPCALWQPCGCPGDRTETPFWEDGDGDGNGLCARSATGTHHYVEGEPNRPMASCWALDWEAEIAERAFELGLMPGTHLVRPWWDGDAVQLELVEPQVVRHG